MDVEFWLSAWEENNIGFHQSEYNSIMLEYFSDKELKGKRVFIPMAGKTKDIKYFLEQGAHVTAVECSAKAIQAFYEENDMSCTVKEEGDYFVYESDNLTFYHGDFFKLTPAQTGLINYVYDRASVVALPQDMRKKYMDMIADLIDNDTKLCIITFECDLREVLGPPFMIPATELQGCYAKRGIYLDKKVMSTSPAPRKYQEAGAKELKRILWTNDL
jgi:thiopurine S-methyltransferase